MIMITVTKMMMLTVIKMLMMVMTVNHNVRTKGRLSIPPLHFSYNGLDLDDLTTSSLWMTLMKMKSLTKCISMTVV